MPRDFKAHEIEKRRKVRRDQALQRLELRYPTQPRLAPSGATSPPIKAVDPALRALIDQALAGRR